MICEQLDLCVASLKKKTVSISPKRGRRTGSKKRTQTVIYNSSCSDEIRIKKCIAFADKRELPSCSEHGKTYSLSIGSHSFDCVGVHIDEGVVDTLDCYKCDYAFFLKDTEKRVILVELKGGDVRHGLEQLLATLKLEELKGAFENKKVYGRVSCTNINVPQIYSNTEYILEHRLHELGGNLKIRKTPFIEKYGELDDE